MFPSDRVSEVKTRNSCEFLAARTLLNNPFNNKILNNLWIIKSR